MDDMATDAVLWDGTPGRPWGSFLSQDVPPPARDRHLAPETQVEAATRLMAARSQAGRGQEPSGRLARPGGVQGPAPQAPPTAAERIAQALDARGPLTAWELAHATGLGNQAVHNALAGGAREGRVARFVVVSTVHRKGPKGFAQVRLYGLHRHGHSDD